MEIIIRSDQVEAIVHPTGTAPPTVSGASAPASVVEQAAATGATNAGPAPAAPGEVGTPPAHVGEEGRGQGSGGSALSAGAAPSL